MSWIALKEICLSLASLVCELPLADDIDDDRKSSDPEDQFSEAPPRVDSQSQRGGGGGGGVLSRVQIKKIGDFLISVLIASKHNGVIDKSHEALLSCCERLLTSSM